MEIRKVDFMQEVTEASKKPEVVLVEDDDEDDVDDEDTGTADKYMSEKDRAEEAE